VRYHGHFAPPLREAIKILETETLLEVRPHKGAAVAEISLKTIEEIFELLAPLEGLGMELVMERMDNDKFGLLRNMHDRMIACYRANIGKGALLTMWPFTIRSSPSPGTKF